MTTDHHTFCRICVAGCGIVVTTDGDTVVEVRGNRAHPLSEGYTCPKGRALPSVHHRADRFSGPLVRRGGSLVATTWEDSLDEIATSVQQLVDEHGPRSIGYFCGSGGYFDAAGLFTSNALMRMLATPSYYSDTTIDVISTMVVSELVTGMPGLLAKPDFDRAQVVIIVGSNPVVSHGQTVIMPNPIVKLREITERGQLYVLDPRRTETARLATTHLQGRPGTDHAVFGFLVRELLRDGTGHEYLRDRADGVDDLRRAVEAFDLDTTSHRTGISTADLQDLLDAIRVAGRVAVMTGTGLSMAPDANIANWFIWALEILTESADQPGGVGFTPGFFTQWDRNELPAFRPPVPAPRAPRAVPSCRAGWVSTHVSRWRTRSSPGISVRSSSPGGTPQRTSPTRADSATRSNRSTSSSSPTSCRRRRPRWPHTSGRLPGSSNAPTSR